MRWPLMNMTQVAHALLVDDASRDAQTVESSFAAHASSGLPWFADKDK
jgi:hypothetical protein